MRVILSLKNLYLYNLNLVVLLIIIIKPKILQAEIYHYRDELIGARAASMGGSYTALADDAVGLYYNPAGLIQAKNDSLSMSSNALQIKQLSYKEAIGGEDFSQSARSLFPLFIGGSKKITSNLAVGYSLVTTEIENIDEQNMLENINDPKIDADFYLRNLLNNASMTLYGGGLSIKLGDNVRIGTSLFYYLRTAITLNYQFVQGNNGFYMSNSTYRNIENTGLLPVIGLQIDTGPFKWGASVRRGYNLSDNTTFIFNNIRYNDGDDSSNNDPIVSKRELKGFAEDNPLEVVLGMLINMGSYFKITSDVSYIWGTENEYPDEGDYERNPTLNWSVGTELSIMNRLYLRGGYFTNNTFLSEVEEGTMNSLPYINYYGVTFGFSIETKSVGIFLGAIKQRGRGKSQLISNSILIQDMEGTIDIYFFGTTFYY